MGQRRTFLTINRRDQWDRGLIRGLEPEGDSLCLRPDKSLYVGAFYSAAIDSGETDFAWGRVKILGEFADSALVRCGVYAANIPFLDEEEPDIDALLSSPHIAPERKAARLDPIFRGTTCATDFLAGVTGRYLWLRVELICTGLSESRLDAVQVQYRGDHMMDYLPGMYTREDPEGFTRRFVSIFDSMALDLEEEIYDVANRFDPERTGGETLRYLAEWLCIDEEATDEELRARIRTAFPEYRLLQTPGGIKNLITRWTGVEPILVEHFNVDNNVRSGKDQKLYKRLFGENPFRFFVLLPERAFKLRSDADLFLQKLKRVIPAHVDVELALLKDGVYLDWNSYVGVNAQISGFKEVAVDESVALDYNSIIGAERTAADKEGGKA